MPNARRSGQATAREMAVAPMGPEGVRESGKMVWNGDASEVDGE